MRDLPYSRFLDRQHAGAELAQLLEHYSQQAGILVLALPRGGVPVAAVVAERLGAELDVFVVRKIGMPGHREFAVGAIAPGGIEIVNRDVLRAYAVPEAALAAVIAEERHELDRRERLYRGAAALPAIGGRIVILVDDGLATGATMRAAVVAVRRSAPARVVVAVPVGAPSTCRELSLVADEVVCARTPEPFAAVGEWYVDFDETSDAEVQALLARHRQARR